MNQRLTVLEDSGLITDYESLWEWFRKGSPSRPKEINLRRKLITWVDNKYVWEISGKTDHRREWKLLYVRSADLG